MNWFIFASVITWAVAVVSASATLGMVAGASTEAELGDDRKARRYAFLAVAAGIVAVLSIAVIAGAGMHAL